MNLTRRDLLQLGAASAIGLGISGCQKVPKLASSNLPTEIVYPSHSPSRLWRLVNRVGFGATPTLLRDIETRGEKEYLEEQLNSDAEIPLELKWRLSRMDIENFSSMELRDLPENEVIRQVQQAAILRAVYNPNQLEERMVDFWTNHFNIFARKGWTAYRVATDQREVIRKHALGKFSDLIKASTKSPAMLAYLDNQLNVKSGPNENYARELMELHTLGVDGGYTQQDVREVARCFTGWTIERRFLRPRGQWRFDESIHDAGSKIVLGNRIQAGGGEKDVSRVLDILTEHPSCARFISRKLCRYFLGEPSEEIQRSAERTFTESKGDLKQVVRVILESDELYTSPYLLKRPFDFMVSALRAIAGETDGNTGIQKHLEMMGQPLFQWPMPDGYPDKTEAWTSSLLARWNFCLALTAGEIDGTRIELKQLAERIPGSINEGLVRLTHGELTQGIAPNLLQEIASRPQNFITSGEAILHESVALCLASPDFQWR